MYYNNFVSQYFDAVCNEIALDEMAYSMLEMDNKIENHFPRPSKSLKYLSRVPKLFRNCIIISWKYWFSYLYFFYQFLKHFLTFKKTPLITHTLDAKNVAIAFSVRATEIINKRNIGHDIDFWIVCNWIDSRKITKDINCINIMSFLKISDLFRILKLSIRGHIKLCISSPQWTLQSYTAFRWFLVKIALEKLACNFYIAEHFDRWAVLMDGLTRVQSDSDKRAYYSIVQHGIVENISETIELALPYKLRYTTKLFVYDLNSESIFKNKIFAPELSKIIKEIKYFESELQLTDIQSNKFKIFLIGNPICEKFHAHLLNKLADIDNLEFYYKPHPLTPGYLNFKANNFFVIKNKEFYPRVNLVISYPSTLEFEYKKLGINTFTHPIDIKIQDSNVLIGKLNRYLLNEMNYKREINLIDNIKEGHQNLK